MENIWLLFVVVAQFLNAVVVLIDKYIVTNSSIKPVVYTFYVSLLSGVALIVLPFGLVTIPQPLVLWLSMAAALSYILSILFLYESLRISPPSEVVPVVGAVSAISTFGFSYWILGDLLPNDFLLGFGLLVLGMLFISHFHFTKKSFAYLILAGVFFGLSTVLIKGVFTYESSFANGFFWSRMANVVGALILLLWPGNLKSIKGDMRHSPAKGKLLILNNKFLAGLAFLFLLISIKLSDDVALVNALSSLQYVFLLIFAFIFTKQMKDYFSEHTHKGEMLHKISATILIVIGFIVLFV